MLLDRAAGRFIVTSLFASLAACAGGDVPESALRQELEGGARGVEAGALPRLDVDASAPPAAEAGAACAPGTQTFSTPGAYTFVVPDYLTLSVEVWGAGGAGEASGAQAPNATAGGDSSFGAVIAGGGGAGTYGAGGKGGAATGGLVNTPGGGGGPGVHYPVIGSLSSGGAAPNGGKGGAGVNGVDPCGGGDGRSGDAPGGGGAPSWSCQGAWLQGYGWGDCGGSGGGGAYASTDFKPGALPATVPIVVGKGGAGSLGQVSSQVSGQGKNPGHYTGGDGAPGAVKVTWTCRPAPEPSEPNGPK